MRRIHDALGVRVAGFRLSLPAPGGRYVDDPELWPRAEAMLRAALEHAGVAYVEAPGEAAFYGPKVDVQILDAAGRDWTLATVQIDLHQPARFDLSYVDDRGERRRPVLVHHSLAGGMERLFGHLIEVHDGAFPAWFAPVQVVVLPLGAEQDARARAFVEAAVAAGLRAELAVEGSLGARIRDAVRRRIPYAAVIGAREAAAGAVALRLRDGRSLDPMPVAAALAAIREDADAPLTRRSIVA